MSESTSKFKIPQLGAIEPDSLDAIGFYQSRAAKLAIGVPPGWEKLAYKIFGYDLMASWVFALDPNRLYKFTTVPVSPFTRERELSCWGLQARSVKNKRVITQTSNLPDLTTPDPYDRTPNKTTVTTDQISTVTHVSQQPYRGLMKDTSKSTRLSSAEGGEFELFTIRKHVPPRTITYVQDNKTHNVVGGHEQVVDSYRKFYRNGQGPGCTFTTTDLDQLYTDETALFATVASENASGMYLNLMPRRPVFDLFYNIAELKDIPRLYRGSVKYFVDQEKIAKNAPKHLASDYLSWQFGWKQLYSSIVDFLETPERVAKRLNWLLSRRDKRTNLKSVKRFSLGVDSVPTPTYNNYTGESSINTGYVASRDIELRMAVNAIIRLPDVEVPKLRRELLLDLWGVNPSPADVYNLLPWSWLVDWFTGLGDYVSILDTINQDRDLINYGYFTYLSRGEARYTRTSKVTDTRFYRMQGVLSSSSKVRTVNYNASLRWKFHKRVDLTTVSGVKSASSSDLSEKQLTIIGALLTQGTTR